MKRLIDLSVSRGFKIDTDRFYYANHHYYQYLKKYIHFLSEPVDFMNIKLPELFSGVAELDELYVWLEARGSGSNSINKILSQVAFQSGKSGFDILWSAQLSSSVDKRIRLLTDYFLVALTPSERAYRYAYVSSQTIVRFKWPKREASAFYQYYDTRERIMPIEAEQEIRVKEAKKKQTELKDTVDSLEESAVSVKKEDERLKPDDIEREVESTKTIQNTGIPTLMDFMPKTLLTSRGNVKEEIKFEETVPFTRYK